MTILKSTHLFFSGIASGPPSGEWPVDFGHGPAQQGFDHLASDAGGAQRPFDCETFNGEGTYDQGRYGRAPGSGLSHPEGKTLSKADFYHAKGNFTFRIIQTFTEHIAG